MRVERADVSKVKDRLKVIKRNLDDTKNTPAKSAVEEYEARIALQLIEEETRKRQRRESAQAKRIERETLELETADPEIAELLGFNGFGSSKNRRLEMQLNRRNKLLMEIHPHYFVCELILAEFLF